MRQEIGGGRSSSFTVLKVDPSGANAALPHQARGSCPGKENTPAHKSLRSLSATNEQNSGQHQRRPKHKSKNLMPTQSNVWSRPAHTKLFPWLFPKLPTHNELPGTVRAPLAAVYECCGLCKVGQNAEADTSRSRPIKSSNRIFSVA